MAEDGRIVAAAENPARVLPGKDMVGAALAVAVNARGSSEAPKR